MGSALVVRLFRGRDVDPVAWLAAFGPGDHCDVVHRLTKYFIVELRIACDSDLVALCTGSVNNLYQGLVAFLAAERKPGLFGALSTFTGR